MDDDATRLYGEDRSRFVAIHTEFLKNPNVPWNIRVQEARGTESVLRQLNELLGEPHA